MSTFRPKTGRACRLNFDDKFFYELSLHENVAKSLAEVADRQLSFIKKLDERKAGAADEAYNAALDAVDELLGSGAGADIMSLFENPGLFDVADVISYIAAEYRAAYSAYIDSYRTVGTPPVGSARGRR